MTVQSSQFGVEQFVATLGHDEQSNSKEDEE